MLRLAVDGRSLGGLGDLPRASQCSETVGLIQLAINEAVESGLLPPTTGVPGILAADGRAGPATRTAVGAVVGEGWQSMSEDFGGFARSWSRHGLRILVHVVSRGWPSPRGLPLEARRVGRRGGCRRGGCDLGRDARSTVVRGKGPARRRK